MTSRLTVLKIRKGRCSSRGAHVLRLEKAAVKYSGAVEIESPEAPFAIRAEVDEISPGCHRDLTLVTGRVQASDPKGFLELEEWGEEIPGLGSRSIQGRGAEDVVIAGQEVFPQRGVPGLLLLLGQFPSQSVGGKEEPVPFRGQARPVFVES
jgi:hypothetical protein